jgi:prevent-host-death family protein
MSKDWQLQEAKNKLTEVINKALSSGPQTITRRGKKTAVVISIEDYKKLTSKAESLADFFKNSPFKDIDIDLERDSDTGREIDL